MKYPKLEENIAAMKELLNWYETGEDEPKRCPLCRVNVVTIRDTGNCEGCPWLELTNDGADFACENPGREGFEEIGGLNEERDPDFLATRIPQLKKWIEVYEKELGA